jgi:twitching motility protein PilT
MSLVPSLLQAILNVNGEALVMHAGEKPYVVAPSGQIELASRGLTIEAVDGIVGQLLPVELQRALDEFGAVQYELPEAAVFPREHFTVVAARGGDDLWIEIRRRRLPDEDHIPEELLPPRAGAPIAATPVLPPLRPAPPQAVQAPLPPVAVVRQETVRAEGPIEEPDEALVEEEIDEDLTLPDADHLFGRRREVVPAYEFDDVGEGEEFEIDLDAPEPSMPQAAPPVHTPPPILTPPPVQTPPIRVSAPPPLAELPLPIAAPPPLPVAAAPPPIATPAPTPVAKVPAPIATPPPPAVAKVPVPIATPPSQAAGGPPPIAAPRPTVAEAPPTGAEERRPEPVAALPVAVPPPSTVVAPPAAPPAVAPPRTVPPPPAVVLPMSRNPIRSTEHLATPPVSDPTMSGLDRLLRVSAARGASTLYLSTDAQPSVRVDGELQTIDAEPVLSARDVESLLLTLMPERSHEALRTGAATEWICEIESVGRVRCLSFRDHRGPGGVFRLMPTRSVSVDQLGLPRSVQALTIEPEGLVLVAGPRSSGKRTLLSAFVDQINRTRRDHVITIEREINIVHEPGSSFISQREVRGNDEDMLAAARAALREDPDVLVVEDLRTSQLMNVALEAAAAGRLVVGGFSAHTAAGAIDRIIDLYAPEYRGQVQLALADCLRGVIVQVLLRKTGGGRVPAREVLLNTPAVSSAIAEGKTSQLAMAIEGGRRYGMMPINDALVSLVQSGVVDAREAYRQSTDRSGYLATLKRSGVDTSFVERLA